MTFTWAENKKFIIDHTGVDEKYGEKCYGKQLVMKAVEYARIMSSKFYRYGLLTKK